MITNIAITLVWLEAAFGAWLWINYRYYKQAYQRADTALRARYKAESEAAAERFAASLERNKVARKASMDRLEQSIADLEAKGRQANQ